MVANVCATAATGSAEREAALVLLDTMLANGTVGGDKNFDVESLVSGVRALGHTPHVAQKAHGTAIDGRTTRHTGYAISQRNRKLVEQVFGYFARHELMAGHIQRDYGLNSDGHRLIWPWK